MSKNIVIQEGGIGKQLTADKLKTNLVGGGTCLWVPEDGTRLGTKYISENGTYRASDDGYYGYSEVTVNGVGSVTGKDPDTGEDVTVTKDPYTGEIVETVLPASISVVTPPAITTYSDGATIDFSGMVVKAYLKSGEPWTDSGHPNGVIPISELMLPVTIADSDETIGGTAEYSGLNTGGFTQPIPLSGSASFSYETGGADWGYHWHDEYIVRSGTAMIITQNNSAGLHFVYASATQNGGYTIKETKTAKDASGEQTITYEEHSLGGANAYTYNGKTVYWTTGGTSGITHLDPEPLVNGYGDNNYRKQAAWVAVYGNITPGGQPIPVQFLRSDGKILESSFNITVT